MRGVRGVSPSARALTPLSQRTVKAPVGAAGSLRVGVVADTHSAPNRKGLEYLSALEPDVILHGGDIGELEVLDQLQAIAPVHAVRGNIDTRAPDLPDVLVLELEREGVRLMTVLLTHIAVAGPRIRADAAKRARAAGANLIVCGHSHLPFLTQEQGLTLFNPGSIGPRRFGLPIVFGVLELERSGVSLRHVDAETGLQWRP